MLPGAAMQHWYYYAQGAFTVWMLYDCARRGADAHWYLITLAPFGAWIYFFAVKIHDYDLGALRRRFTPREPLDALRFRARDAPSLDNRLRLAERLRADGLHREAVTTYELALVMEADDRATLHGLARSKLALGDDGGAVAALSRLVSLELGFAQYAAALELAQALGRLGRDDEALALLRELSQRSGALEHHVLLGRALVEGGHFEEASGVLGRALEVHRYAPARDRRRDRRAAREAVALLETLGGRR